MDGSYLITFSPDGKVLASLLRGKNSIEISEVGSGRSKKALSLKGRSYSFVSSGAFSPDGKILATGGYVYTVKQGNSFLVVDIWNVEKGKLIKTLGEFRGSMISVSSPSVIAFNPASNGILASGGDKTVRIWDVNSGQLVRSLEGHTKNVFSVAFSPDGRILASGGADKTIKLWDPGTGKIIRTLETHSHIVNSVSFSTDGNTLAMGNGDYTLGGRNLIKLWDMSRGRSIRSFKGKSGWVTTVALSPDGKVLASGECDQSGSFLDCVKGDVKLWDANTGQPIMTLKGHPAKVASVAFSPDGNTLASGGCEKTTKNMDHACESSHLKLWDVNSGQLIHSLEGHASKMLAKVTSVAFNPDGKLLASGSHDQTVKLWDVNTGRLIRTLEGHTGGLPFIFTVAFSPDGKLLASGSRDKTVKIWKVSNGKAIKTLKTEIGGPSLGRIGVYSVSFSPDGKTLASGYDNIIKLWDVTTGQLLRTLKGHLGSVSSVSFNPGGKILASGSLDNMIKFWNVNTGKLLCTLIPLDDEDWIVYNDEGYFDSSTNASKYIGWTVGMKNYSFDQFYDEFYQPGLFSRVVGGQKIEVKKDIRKGFALPPDVTIKSPKAGTTIDGTTVDVVVQATDTGGGVQDIRLYHNDKLVGRGERGIGGVRESGKVVTQKFKVTLMEGENKLRATAYSADNIEAVPYEVTIRSAIKAKKPNLFVITIAVDNYKNKRYRLKYSKADAMGIINTFAKQKGRIFEQVYKRELFNEKATRANIINALKLPTKPEDVVIIYFAGHGLAIDGNYYYLPYEITDVDDVTVKKMGVPQHEIIKALREVNARKVLMLLDTCQAGALVLAMRGVDEERAVKLLSKTAGVHVLAASKDSQAAAEIEKLGHGLFTHALIQGLSGKADHNRDKTIRISELLGYVCSEVETVARQYGKEQFPTMDMHGDDFPLAVY